MDAKKKNQNKQTNDSLTLKNLHKKTHWFINFKKKKSLKFIDAENEMSVDGYLQNGNARKKKAGNSTVK